MEGLKLLHVLIKDRDRMIETENTEVLLTMMYAQGVCV